mmetsp:Transcript_22487/g.39775  ORF Transcript_22487/g.39775 Transcript_22487/m.39775 type:complete len:133 (-) Transcript_22487:289-687(-)
MAYPSKEEVAQALPGALARLSGEVEEYKSEFKKRGLKAMEVDENFAFVCDYDDSAAAKDKAIEDAVVEAYKGKMQSLVSLAPDLESMYEKYKNLTEPRIVYGRPDKVLLQFSKLYPELIRLGGCMRPDPGRS